jgi:hypothetical protein
VTARRLPNGLLRPELADLLEGMRVAEKLGLDQVPHDALIAVGRAVNDQVVANYTGPVYPDGGAGLSPQSGQKDSQNNHYVNHDPDQGGRGPGDGDDPDPEPVQVPDQQERRPSVTGNRNARDIPVESDNSHEQGQGDSYSDVPPTGLDRIETNERIEP